MNRVKRSFPDERSSKTKNYNKNKGLLVTQTGLITPWLSDVYLVDAPVDAGRGTVGELCGNQPLVDPSTGVHRTRLLMDPAGTVDPS